VRSPKSQSERSEAMSNGLPKCPTGIAGLDEITLGGLPRGRPTLVCGGAGCGKTLLGVRSSFEETAGELARNVASLGFDLIDVRALAPGGQS